MLFSQTVEYALRAVVWLALHEGKGQTTQQIADSTRVPREYLSKVLQALARGGIVHAQRGVGGGFTLLRNPEELTLLETIEVIEPVEKFEHCPLSGMPSTAGLCRLHKTLDKATSAFEQVCAETTIAHLVEVEADGEVLCPISEFGPFRISRDQPRRNSTAG